MIFRDSSLGPHRPAKQGFYSQSQAKKHNKKLLLQSQKKRNPANRLFSRRFINCHPPYTHQVRHSGIKYYLRISLQSFQVQISSLKEGQ